MTENIFTQWPYTTEGRGEEVKGKPYKRYRKTETRGKRGVLHPFLLKD